jgi:ABC-2 type transport system permease protein
MGTDDQKEAAIKYLKEVDPDIWGRTDAPLGAVGVAVGISILLSILDAITALGSVRDWLPVHYAFTWFDALSTIIDWSEMIRGASYSAITGILFYALAINKFAKKDITS